ncbi:MAG: signal peptide peptidase SppA [bacterium]
MRKRNILIGCGILFFTLVLFIVLVALISQSFTGRMKRDASFAVGGGGGDKVGVLYVTGIIRTGGEQYSLFDDTGSGSDSIVRALDRGARNRRIKSVLVRINSPGGSAAAAQEIYNQIKRVRTEHGKPVIISMGDVAASGGYYVASAADTIFADPATITGSIGVIMEYLNLEGTLDKIGMAPITFKSVRHKDIGSPFRPLSEEEKAILQDAIDGIHNQFVADVAAGRNLPLDEVKKIADGRFYTGEQALKLKLVDRTGGYQEALEYAARAGGLKVPPDVEYLQRVHPFSFLTAFSRLAMGRLTGRDALEGVAGYLLAPPWLIQE